MKEIEVLVQVLDSKEKTLNVLSKFKLIGIKETKDIYFFDESKDTLQMKKEKYPTKWFRIRKKGEKNYITYKEDIFDGKGNWLHSHEHETEIKDFEVIHQIIKKLGFKQLIEIDNKKHIYENEEYEIVFEEVENLGYFLEVEKRNTTEKSDTEKIRKEIKEFLKNLNLEISEEVGIGKPELMLRKIKVK